MKKDPNTELYVVAIEVAEAVAKEHGLDVVWVRSGTTLAEEIHGIIEDLLRSRA